MKKLVAFIKQEAMEKAREIKVKADEEFSIEKAKIVRQETTSIDALFAKRRKQVEVQKRITQSTLSNKARLKQLQTRDQLLQEVFEEAAKGLSDLTANQDDYRGIIENLTLQALYSLMAKDIVVSVRPQDREFAEAAISQAVNRFKDESKIECTYSVNDDLPKESKGGVVVYGFHSRIKVNNTLDERLRLLEEKMLPEIRTSLYGKNPNRKHET